MKQELAAEVVIPLKAPKKLFGDIDTEAAAALIVAASDVALVVDDEGVIRELAFGSKELSAERYGTKWLGQPWVETVTAESRPKVAALLREAGSKEVPRWRQVNHPSPRGADVPVLYCAVPVGNKGRVVAVGRDLRAVAALQQRLVDAEQSMERGYARLRQTETRYRLLFQVTSEAVLIVDAASEKVVEANPATGELLGEDDKRIIGRALPEVFGAESTQSIQALLAAVRLAGRADDLKVNLANGAREVLVSASLFRQENTPHFLIRLTPPHTDTATIIASTAKSKLLDIVDKLPDGFVVTDPDGRILSANHAFLDAAQLATKEQARGESLERWLGRSAVDLRVLMANLQQHGAVRLFATTMRGQYGFVTDVEISAVSVLNGEQPCLGFVVRNVGRRHAADVNKAREMPRSVEQLTELVGRVSLKDLVREATDVVERLCIEAALELTGDNRASAAEMLGLSRQSLYVKLHRHGLGDLAAESES